MDAFPVRTEVATVRQAFELAWQEGERPNIEDYLAGEDGADEVLVRELIAIDVRQRLALGDKPQVVDYVVRFSRQAKWLMRELPALLDSTPFPPDSTTVPHRGTPISPDSATPPREQPTWAPPGVPAPPPAGQADPLPFVGRYRLESLLGRGGFGEVWRGFDTQLQRAVAVKLPRPDRQPAQAPPELFLAEARKLAALDLPGIVPIYDVGWDNGLPYIVSKYLDGGSLADRLRREGLKPDEAARLVADVATALHQAHLRNVVHRDVKPGNILLDRAGNPYVADFGVAVTEEEQLAEPRGAVGTYAYMSPEQVNGQSHRIDARADVYSLGVILYQMLTGRLPFLSRNSTDYLEQLADRDPRPPRTIEDRIPPDLERICLKCLAKSVSDRYSTAADLAADLRAFCRQGATPSPWRRRGAGVLVALALAGAGLTAWYLSSPPVSPDPPVDKASVYPPGWRQRLGQEPQELIWPGHKGVGTFSYEADLRALRVTSDYTRLIQLGELPKPPYTISVGMQQVAWLGSGGLFLGYKVVNYKDRPCAEFQSFTVGRVADSEGNKLIVTRNLTCIDSQYGKPFRRRELGDAYVEWPAPGVLPRLELEIGKDGLVAARWNGKLMPTLTSEFNNGQAKPGDYRGLWGLANYRETTWFRDPSLITHGKSETPP